MQVRGSAVVGALQAVGVPPAGLLIAVGMVPLTLIWMAATRAEAKLDQVALALGVGLLLLAGAWLYSAKRNAPVLAAVLGVVGLHWLAAAFAGLQAMLGLAAGFPLIDGHLAAIDRAFGIDHRAIWSWAAARPDTAHALDLVYKASVPLVTLVGVGLALARKFAHLQRYMLLFVLTVTLTALVSTVTPAVGTFVHLGIAPEVQVRLPAGAGVFHMHEFTLLRSGAPFAIGPFELNGVVTFPSFHTCMALLIAYGLAGFRHGRAPGLLIALATLAATVVIGGHYVVDLLGGGAVFAMAWALAHARSRRRSHAVGALQGAAGAV
jgi:hypothetical protein